MICLNSAGNLVQSEVIFMFKHAEKYPESRLSSSLRKKDCESQDSKNIASACPKNPFKDTACKTQEPGTECRGKQDSVRQSLARKLRHSHGQTEIEKKQFSTKALKRTRAQCALRSQSPQAYASKQILVNGEDQKMGKI